MISKPELSIIIPALNEERTITSVLRSLARQAHISGCEVIVVDGMSRDDTATVAGNFPFVRVVTCEPGRARQMNYGAEMALAPVLWFLHADSTIPDPYTIDVLLRALEEPELVGGAFRFHLRGDDLYYRAVNVLVNLRSRLVLRPFGDQGIFVRTEAFRALGGYRMLEACEDLDLVLRMRQNGRFAIMPGAVETSARTWQRYGKIRTTLWHLRQMIEFEWRRRRGKLVVLEEAPAQQAALEAPGAKDKPQALGDLPAQGPVEANAVR